MPELPEVEHLRRSLDPWIVGARLLDVRVARKSVVALTPEELRNTAAFREALGVGETIVRTDRRGKQMAIVFRSGRILVVQLGMTGSLTVETGPTPRGVEGRHRHVVWQACSSASLSTSLSTSLVSSSVSSSPKSDAVPSDRSPNWKLVFRDPRRFGGLTAYRSPEMLDLAWSRLGPDALNIDGAALLAALSRTRRPIKSALLDQSVVAGVGNIYADESLHAAGIHPLAVANAIPESRVIALAAEIRRILGRATEAGGSTLRDYRDAFGQPGNAVQAHAAYGRDGLPCFRCGATLLGTRLQGRATVHCPRCQDLST